MKVVRLKLCLLGSLLLLVSCGKDENEYHPYAAKLEGRWNAGNNEVEYSAPKDSTVYYCYTCNDSTKQASALKYYVHPKTGRLWLRNEWSANGTPKFNDMHDVVFNADYSQVKIGATTWYKQ